MVSSSEQDHISNGEPRDVQQTGEKNAEPTEALEEGEVDEVMGSGEENEAKPDEVWTGIPTADCTNLMNC